MDFICGTTLEIPFIPLADAATLIERSAELCVHQVTDARFGAGTVHGAIVKILSQGDDIARKLGILRLSAEDMGRHPCPEKVPSLSLPIDLTNLGSEYPDYAATYYGTPPDMPVLEAIVHAVCHGELINENGEAHVSEDRQHPPSHHDEMNRRAEIDAAFRLNERARKRLSAA